MPNKSKAKVKGNVAKAKAKAKAKATSDHVGCMMCAFEAMPDSVGKTFIKAKTENLIEAGMDEAEAFNTAMQDSARMFPEIWLIALSKRESNLNNQQFCEHMTDLAMTVAHDLMQVRQQYVDLAERHEGL